MLRAIDHSAPWLPEDKPRYAMGLGTPPQLLEMIARWTEDENGGGIRWSFDAENSKNACSNGPGALCARSYFSSPLADLFMWGIISVVIPLGLDVLVLFRTSPAHTCSAGMTSSRKPSTFRAVAGVR